MAVYNLKKHERIMLYKKVISTATTTAVKNLLVHTTRIKGHATWGETTHEKEFYSFYY